MPHKVLFVQPVMSPYTVPRYIELARKGLWDVTVALEAYEFPTRPGWTPKSIEGVDVQVLKNWLYKKRMADGSYIDKAIPYGLISTIRQVKPDIVIVCNPTELLLAVVARLFVKRFRLGLLMEDTLHSERHKQGWIAGLRKYLFNKVDFIACFSNYAEQYIKSQRLDASIYRTSWTVDPAWLNNTDTEITGETEESSKKEGVIRYLFVGALIERKGVMPLFEAWQLSMGERDDVELVMLGEGPLDGQLKQFRDSNQLNNITFLGSLPYDQVGDVYRSSDVFVLPTMEDLFSLVITEAMAYSLPVLTTIYNGASELIIDSENGYVFDSKNIEEMSQVLSKIAGDVERLPEMGKRSREIIGDYTHEKVMNRFSDNLVQEISK